MTSETPRQMDEYVVVDHMDEHIFPAPNANVEFPAQLPSMPLGGFPRTFSPTSIKASRMSSRAGMASMESLPEGHRVYQPVLQYEERGISAAFGEEVKIVEVEVIKYIEQPRPEVKEMCIQTDEPVPTTPPSTSIPIPPSGQADMSTSSIPLVPTSPMGLFRVSSTGGKFQFVPASSPPPSSPMSGGTPRDSTATFRVIQPLPSQSQSNRRQSIESSITDEAAHRQSTTLAVPSVVDKTCSPMMVLPPPPRLPLPSFIPERRGATMSSASDVPPRPSSPPPLELIHRATTPIGAMLSVHPRGTYGPRQHGSSMPPLSNLCQPPSTRSFQSAANAAAHAQNSQVPSGLPSWSVREHERRKLSSTSLASDRSALSPRSSMSSDHSVFMNCRTTPNATGKAIEQPIHAITQIMIGEWLYKYTRRTIRKGYREKQHQRFFWVHPYTKNLYWSSADPGSNNASGSSSKCAYIEGIRAVLDPNPMPPDLYQYSIVISTTHREMKITAPTKERHEIWLNALKYLLSRPNPLGAPGEAPGLSSPMSLAAEFTDDDHRHPDSSPQSQRSGRSSHNGGAFSTTPKGKRSCSQLSVRGSAGKRSGTPAAGYLRWAAPESPYSPTRSFEHAGGNNHEDAELDFELHGESKSDEGYEGLENIRACCNGRGPIVDFPTI